MRFLSTILETSEIEEGIREDVLQYYKEAKESFASLGVPMEEEAELVFSNHLVALMKRIKTREFVDSMDEKMFSEVSGRAMEKAGMLAAPFFEKEGLPANKTEVFLVATHIELALQKGGETV